MEQGKRQQAWNSYRTFIRGWKGVERVHELSIDVFTKPWDANCIPMQ